MRNVWLAGFLVLASLGAGSSAQKAGGTIRPDAGISVELARDRASRISELRYELSFTIPAERREPVAGQVTIAFTLADPPPTLAVDFDPHRAQAIHAVEINSAPVDVPLVNGHLLVSGSRLHRGPNRISVTFDAGDIPLNRNDDFLYTIFVPARAHETFPCFDQPDLKGRWTLSLDVPEGWEAVGNGAEAAAERQNG